MLKYYIKTETCPATSYIVKMKGRIALRICTS